MRSGRLKEGIIPLPQPPLPNSAGPGPSLKAHQETLGPALVRVVLLVPAPMAAKIEEARGTEPLEEWWEEAAKQRLRRGS